MVDRLKIKKGQIVYYVEKHKNGSLFVDYAMVDEIFSDVVVLMIFDFYEQRYVDGIPYNDVPYIGRWKKLPKNWTYDMPLFKLDYINNPEYIDKSFDVTKPEDILKAYNIGLLVDTRTIDHSHIEADIDKNYGYRLIKKYYPYQRIPGDISLHYDEVYLTFAEAKKAIDDYLTELNRQASLSDEEWSLEQIENTIRHHLFMIYPNKEQIEEKLQSIMDYFKNRNNIEDIEVRISNGRIEWKYWKNKKWIGINPELED